jgi:hypothetical protein
MDEAKAKGIEIVMPVDFACPSKFGEDGGIPAGVMDPRSGHEKSSTREGTPQLRSTGAQRPGGASTSICEALGTPR